MIKVEIDEGSGFCFCIERQITAYLGKQYRHNLCRQTERLGHLLHQFRCRGFRAESAMRL